MARLAQLVERLTVEREVTGSILGILKVLKQLRNEGTNSVELQTTSPSRSLYDRVKWRSTLQLETQKSMSVPI